VTVRDGEIEDDEDVRALVAANAVFYDSFERKDLDAMSALWERSDRVVCTHPGWSTLRGWPHVQASFFAMFDAPGSVQFVLTDAAAHIVGDTGWVTLDENLLGDQAGSTIAALNVFVRDHADRWRLVAHHGSIVNSPPPTFVRREGT
jgi:ketosteroid isomerase-like protein